MRRHVLVSCLSVAIGIWLHLSGDSAPLHAVEPVDSPARGQKMLENYFRHQVQQIADACLTDVKTKEDWEKKRPELRR